MIDRRSLLLGSTGFLVGHTLALGQDRLERSARHAAHFADKDGRYGLALVDESGALIHRHSLPARGHGFAVHRETGRFVAFMRRPGKFALAFDKKMRRPPVAFEPPAGRTFYGHGVFSHDGHLLYTSENDYEAARGMIGIYDTRRDFARLGEFSSGGVGPHEILLDRDGRTLVVANGGIETHPDYGRAKLNLATMAPSIALIDTRHGNLLAKARLEDRWHRVSLRHMAADGTGSIWIGGQYEGAGQDDAPLIFRFSHDKGLETPALPEDELRTMANYVGSVAANKAGDKIAFSSPRGGRLLIINAVESRLEATRSIEKVCAISSGAENGFLAGSETGQLGAKNHPLYWDNHLQRIS